MARKAKRDLTIEQKLARGPIDLPFLALVMLLTALGLIVLLSASFPSAMYNLSPKVTDTGGDPLYYFNRQFGFALMGVVAMFIISKIDYQQFRWMSIFVLAGSVVLMLLVFVPGIGKTGGGAARWIKLGPVRFQPSEIAKVGIILYFAARLSKRGIQLGPPKDKKWNRRTLLGRTCERLDNIGFLELVPYGIALVVVLVVIYLQGHMSAMILVIVAAASVLFAAGISLGWFAAAGAVVAPLLWFIITQTDYMKARIDIWLDPFVDPRGNGYQPIQGRIAIGSGWLLGVGLGNSRQKYLFLPEEHNDYIFSIWCEEMGMVGAVVLMALFALLIIRGFWLALHARDRFGTLLIVGIMSLMAFQVFFNIGVVTGFLPPTGISLPFFSYGGTALMITLGEMGMVLSVSRQITAPKAE
ncbi:MAG: putative lipid II flippase FtsW [Oscillospiraceae bacterium]|nr:putative lipid II flippase FtsW [Oscillospiraceae bacterium]